MRERGRKGRGKGKRKKRMGEFGKGIRMRKGDRGAECEENGRVWDRNSIRQQST